MKIFFVVPYHTGDPCVKYRSLWISRGLNPLGVKTKVQLLERTLPKELDDSNIVVFQRVTTEFFHKTPNGNNKSEIINQLFTRARKQGKIIGWDLDDYLGFPDGIEGYRDLADLNIKYIKKCDYFTATTQKFVDKVRQYNPNSFLIQNSIDMGLFGKKKTDFNNTNPVIGWTAGSNHGVDEDIFIKVAKLAEKDKLRASFQLVGKVVQKKNKPIFASLRNCKTVNPVKHDNLPKLLKTFDINFCPLTNVFINQISKSEVKYLEGAACGLPTVASRTGAFAATVKDGVTGILGSDPGELYLGIRKLVKNIELRRKMGEAAYNEVAAHHSNRVRAKQYLNFIKGLRK